ncbi:hypothetical protein [Lysobacter gummosus]|uniref:Secreted protein n=1 Tax=Lysobacter gummosus TaxID=262324 RepID=A0ABY3XC79_9GAMM|nr:hypothetical protein [Lysobacter gummosus]UNP29220.1 hypothetical protein MOV92_22585 [Lysobacter gummosus]
MNKLFGHCAAALLLLDLSFSQLPMPLGDRVNHHCCWTTATDHECLRQQPAGRAISQSLVSDRFITYAPRAHAVEDEMRRQASLRTPSIDHSRRYAARYLTWLNLMNTLIACLRHIGPSVASVVNSRLRA